MVVYSARFCELWGILCALNRTCCERAQDDEKGVSGWLSKGIWSRESCIANRVPVHKKPTTSTVGRMTAWPTVRPSARPATTRYFD
jgi:hypothetical protein